MFTTPAPPALSPITPDELIRLPPDCMATVPVPEPPTVKSPVLFHSEPVPLIATLPVDPEFAPTKPAALFIRPPATTFNMPFPLPAKFRLRFLEPADVADEPLDPGSLAALASDLRALIQENLFEMLGARRSVWLG